MEVFGIIGRYNNLGSPDEMVEPTSESLTKTMTVVGITLMLPDPEDGNPADIPAEDLFKEQVFPTMFHLLNHAADLGLKEIHMVNPVDESNLMTIVTPDGFRYDTDGIVEMAVNQPEEFIELSAADPASFLEQFQIPTDGGEVQTATKKVTRLSEEDGMDSYLDDQEGRESIDAQLNAIFDEIGIMVN